MAIGARPPITVTSGNRARRNRAPGVHTPMATGFTRTLAGLGSRKSRLVGRRITTDVGRACAISAGSGCPAMNGRRRGFPGARAVTTSVGPELGDVWQPGQAQSRTWRPYTDGHWVYTDVGWTWVSEEPFGWATYHYGRWTRLRNIGWVWVPGDEWAPAWVSWRKSSDYVGWA